MPLSSAIRSVKKRSRKRVQVKHADDISIAPKYKYRKLPNRLILIILPLTFLSF